MRGRCLQNVAPDSATAQHLNPEFKKLQFCNADSSHLEPSAFEKYFGFQRGVSERKSGFKPPPLHVTEQFDDKTVEGGPAVKCYNHVRSVTGGRSLQVVHHPLALGIFAVACNMSRHTSGASLTPRHTTHITRHTSQVERHKSPGMLLFSHVRTPSIWWNTG